MKKSMIYLALAVCLFSSCQKDKDGNSNADPLTLLTGKSWKPALSDKNNGTNPTGSNTYRPTPTCEQDDNYLFATTNKLTLTRGTQQCISGETNPEITDYSVDFNSNRITIKGTPYTLAEVSETQLKYYAVTPQPSGFTNVIFIFEH